MRLVVALAALLSVAACADDGPDATSAGEPTATVTIERSRFDATEVHVAVGATVEFVNLDAAAHTVTSMPDAPAVFDSGELGESGSFEATFDEPGEYRYFCEIHPTMRAMIVVS